MLFAVVVFTKSQCIYFINAIVENLPESVPSVLLTLHSLIGCEIVDKVGPKAGVLKLTQSFPLIARFGKDMLTADMISNAEHFLVNCLLRKFSVDIKTFDRLRVFVYYNKVDKLDLSKPAMLMQKMLVRYCMRLSSSENSLQ